MVLDKNAFKTFMNSQNYKLNPLEKFFMFTIHQNYTFGFN